MTTINGSLAGVGLMAPHNLEAEKSVLGAVLLDERHLIALVADEQLRVEHFYCEQHASVFAAMLALQDAGRKIDHLTVTEALRQHGTLELVGGQGAVEELAGWVPAAGHARDYARIVREHAQMRRLLRATYEIQAQIAERSHTGEALLDEAERIIFALRSHDLTSRQRLLEHAVEEEIDHLAQAGRDGSRLPGRSTGLGDLDQLLGGLQPGRLYVLAGRPAMGKSLFALQLARSVAIGERSRVLFASLARR